jgi:hypothetical protein
MQNLPTFFRIILRNVDREPLVNFPPSVIASKINEPKVVDICDVIVGVANQCVEYEAKVVID